ncbi:unnamed protein product, partial [Trichogramma brassicae]
MGLNVDDDVDKLRDRLTRFEIRTRFGDDKAMWDPVQDVASQRPAGSVASNNQAAVEATPLASSPNKLGNNFRQWRNMHNISESSSLMDTVIDGNAERARRVAEEESAESVAESELRGRVDDLVHTEQQRALESSNEGRSESVNREEIVHSSEREEQIAPSEFERGPAAGATSTVRRVAFVNDSNAVNRNKADRATVSGVDGATPAAFVTARSRLYQSEILGAGSNAAQSEPLDLLISGGSSPVGYRKIEVVWLRGVTRGECWTHGSRSSGAWRARGGLWTHGSRSSGAWRARGGLWTHGSRSS